MINQKLNYKLLLLLIGTLLLLIGTLLLLIPYGKVSATLTNTGCEGLMSGNHYKKCRVDSGDKKEIYGEGTGCNYTCREVENNCAEHVFIPTKICKEWNKFVAFHPGCINTSECPQSYTLTAEIENPSRGDLTIGIWSGDGETGRVSDEGDGDGVREYEIEEGAGWEPDDIPYEGYEFDGYTGICNVDKDYNCCGTGVCTMPSHDTSITAHYVGSCSCTFWSAGSCGGGSCGSDYREYTRDCDPNGCKDESKCEYDSDCESNNPASCNIVSLSPNTITEDEKAYIEVYGEDPDEVYSVGYEVRERSDGSFERGGSDNYLYRTSYTYNKSFSEGPGEYNVYGKVKGLKPDGTKEDWTYCGPQSLTVSGTVTGCTDRDRDGYCGPDEPEDLCDTACYEIIGTMDEAEDCFDCDDEAYPGADGWHSSGMGGCGTYDYNCDGTEEKRWTNVGDCDEEGWKGSVAACGQTKEWCTGTGCRGWGRGCESESKTQECR